MVKAQCEDCLKYFHFFYQLFTHDCKPEDKKMPIESLSETDVEGVKWQAALHGDFYRSVYKAIALADDINREKLRTLFPIQVQAFTAWTLDPGYAGGLRDRMERSAPWKSFIPRLFD